MVWSLENELCKLAQTTTLEKALFKLRLIHTNQYSIIHSQAQWKRGGAETFIYPFTVTCKEITQNCLLKACVTSNFGQGIENIMETWIQRRHLLNKYISSPKLFAYGNGVLLEEFIPYSVRECIAELANFNRHNVIQATAYLAGVLVRMEFNPVEVFSDLRSRGNDAVMVDFGEDLGSPYLRTPISADGMLSGLLKKFAIWNIKDLQSLKPQIHLHFQAGLNCNKHNLT